MTRESIVQLIGVAVFVATVVVTILAIVHLFTA